MFISVLLPLPELPMIATKSPRVDPQRDVAQRAHPDLPELVGLGDLVHLYRPVAADARPLRPAVRRVGACAPAAGCERTRGGPDARAR